MANDALDPAYKHELEALKQHVDIRFDGVREWIERVSLAIERLADQRDRIIVVEQTSHFHDQQIKAQEKVTETMRKDFNDQSAKVIRLTCYIAIAGGIFAVLAPIFIPMWIHP
jgi:uncharacterized protein (DUF924 family)